MSSQEERKIGVRISILVFALTLSASISFGQSTQDGWPTTHPAHRAYSTADLSGDGCQEVFLFDIGVSEFSVRSCDGEVSSEWTGLSYGPWQDLFRFGDIDGDGFSEVVTLNRVPEGLIFAFEQNGDPVPGWPVVVGDGTDRIGRVAVADVTGDGVAEVIACELWNAALSRVWVFNGDGTVRPGWPQVVDEAAADLVIGDLDFDGTTEIVVSSVETSFVYESGYPIYAFDCDGVPRPGFPLVIPHDPGSVFFLQAADLDGDYQCELIGVGTTEAGPDVLYVVRLDGTLAMQPIFAPFIGIPAIGNLDEDPDLEFVLPWLGISVWNVGDPHAQYPAQGDFEVFGSVNLADLDGDGICEIATQSRIPRAQHVFDANLQELPGWPKVLDPATFDSFMDSAIVDLDGDGDLELMYMDWREVEVWDFSSPPGGNPRIVWGQVGHDPGRTNYFHHGVPVLPRFLRGDTNSDGEVSFDDALHMIGVLFGPSSFGTCPARFDFYSDGLVDIADIVASLSYAFVGGPPPVDPFPKCLLHDEALPCALEPCP